MTEEEFKSLGPKYNLYYSIPDSTLSFKSDSSNPAFVVAFYNEDGFVQVYPECLGVAFETDDNLEIATSGVTSVCKNSFTYELITRTQKCSGFFFNFFNKNALTR